MQREVWVNGEKLTYTWEKKRVKNLNLRIRPDGSIAVSSAVWVPAAMVDDFVRSRAGLIGTARRRWQTERPQQAFLPVQGAALPCLGRTLTIQLRQGKEEARCEGNRLLLTLRDPADGQAAQRLLERWWKETCRQLFAALTAKWFPRFERWNIPKPVLRTRRMSSRWGSCQPQTAAITLNERLLHAPVECVEYIIVHELAHLVQPDHSPAFHAVVAEVMPDWKARRQRLREAVIPQ